ncbi:hypothetical protein N7G274_009592 [Stereocaulon virgatum]|uniref:Uncharacterized protein n=1 Tax=Stereocaulon virgatum TaxID=373712 RepID=A0ABR3ZVM8_9LECA
MAASADLNCHSLSTCLNGSLQLDNSWLSTSSFSSHFHVDVAPSNSAKVGRSFYYFFLSRIFRSEETTQTTGRERHVHRVNLRAFALSHLNHPPSSRDRHSLVINKSSTFHAREREKGREYHPS